MTSSLPKSAGLTDTGIIAHYQAGTLLRELQYPLDVSQREALQEQLAALHNARGIDLLALVATPEFQKLERRHFFTIQQIYCAIVPFLNAATPAMLEMVRRLMTHRSAGGIAATPRAALLRWIEQAAERANEIIEIARSDHDIDCEILLGALVARGDLSSAMSFIAAADPRRRAAVAALGAIMPRNQRARDAAFGKLVAIASADPDDGIRFTAIFSAFNLLQHCKAQAPQWVPVLVATVTAVPSDSAREALLHGLWRHTELLRPTDAKAILSLAIEGDLAATHLVGTLDATLSHLIDGIYHNLAIDCLTALCTTSGKAIPLDNFQMLEHRLMELDQGVLFALAVRWFGTGDQILCKMISKLIGSMQHRHAFDASLAGFGLTSSQMIVLCHKAVGYMPLSPIMAASFVVAALRVGDKAVEAELIQLLLQSLLINSRDTVATYLKTIGKADIAYQPVRVALKLYRSYERGLKIKTPIKELLPSSYQRGVVRQNHYVTGREIRKQAERQSIFFGLAHHSTLLYGRKAITYACGADEPPMSMEMNSISFHVEMPRLQIIDPVGLDWLFRIFQLSKPK